MPTVINENIAVFGDAKSKTTLRELLFADLTKSDDNEFLLTSTSAGASSDTITHTSKLSFQTTELSTTNLIVLDHSKGAISAENFPASLIPEIPDDSAAKFKVVVLNTEADESKAALMSPIATHFHSRGIAVTEENLVLATNPTDMTALKTQLGITSIATIKAVTAVAVEAPPTPITEVDYYKQMIGQYLAEQSTRLANTTKSANLAESQSALGSIATVEGAKTLIQTIRTYVGINRNPISWLFGIQPTSLRKLNELFDADGTLKRVPEHVVKATAAEVPVAAAPAEAESGGEPALVPANV